MELIKNIWNKEDIKELNNYLLSLEQKDNIPFEQKIVRTNKQVLAIPSPKLKEIAKQILKGNFLSFLENNDFKYYENILISGYIIPKVKDFLTLKHQLDNYVKVSDCWATCDVLKFNIKNLEDKFLTLAQNYTNSPLTFVRRTGIIILFSFVKSPTHINQIFSLLNTFYNEEEYYVNMANAWLVCELFINYREQTLKFLQTHKLNKFTVNKAIQKCRESFRVSNEDKEMLLKFKI